MSVNDQVELRPGDLVSVEADVVVVAANTEMTLEDVAPDLRNEAGEEVEEEAMAQAPVALGDVVVTSGGDLAAGHIVHVAVIGSEAPDVYTSTRSALEAAAELGAERAALPALGIQSVPVEEAAGDMHLAITDFLTETGSDIDILLVIEDEEDFEVFESVFQVGADEEE